MVMRTKWEYLSISIPTLIAHSAVDNTESLANFFQSSYGADF
jgi:hypothetical protein